MALALESRAMKDDIMLGDTPKAKRRRHRMADVKTRGRLWKHATLADLDGLVRPEELDDLFIFTLVRNPWDRMVSYYHWLRAQSFEHAAVGLAKERCFEDFVLDPQILASWKATPARHYVSDLSGTDRGNLYIRLEAFAEDAQPLWDHLGFELDLPKSNASERDADYSDYYSPQTRDAVARAGAEDIARFGYEFAAK